MNAVRTEERAPTRLMVIARSSAAVYAGTQRLGGWSTGEGGHPFDADFCDQVLPSIYDLEWMADMAEQGRVFPLLDQPGDILTE